MVDNLSLEERAVFSVGSVSKADVADNGVLLLISFKKLFSTIFHSFSHVVDDDAVLLVFAKITAFSLKFSTELTFVIIEGDTPSQEVSSTIETTTFDLLSFCWTSLLTCSSECLFSF